jgi:hypothetical protein
MTLWSPTAPDEKKLYVIDTGFTDGPDNPSHIRVFDVDVGAGKVSNSKVFAEMPKPSITELKRGECSCRSGGFGPSWTRDNPDIEGGADLHSARQKRQSRDC